MKVWYNTSEPTVPINFNKFLASFPGEEYFDADLVPEDEMQRPDWYTIEWNPAPSGAPSGDVPSLVRKDQSVIDATEMQQAKDLALEDMVSLIGRKGDEENAKPFPYTKNSVDYLFVSDKQSIQGTMMAIAHATDGTAPIPTFRNDTKAGTWKCNEAATGNTVFLPFTIDEFNAFADDYYNRWSDNFTTYSNHIDALIGIYEDPEQTANDMTSYDYSTGWV